MTTTRRLTVWVLSAGLEQAAVAAPSKRAAVTALNAAEQNWSMYSFNQFASSVRDDHPIAVMALEQPGVVFVRPNGSIHAPWGAA